MAVTLATSSAVVVAQQFNPSVTGQNWLIQNGIILREELLAGAAFTDMFAQVPTRDFNLFVVAQNCQFAFPPTSDDTQQKQQGLLKERLAKLISLIPHTPYTGVGLNFVWHFFPDNETIETACRRLFFLAGKPPYESFNESDARFGAYMSANWDNYRLGLDVRPVSGVLPTAPQNEVIQLAFNYHLNLAGRPRPAEDIIGALGQWIDAWQNSKSITASIIEHK
jgi:hypothetical protein